MKPEDKIVVVRADCRDVLTVARDSLRVQCCVTSPPYWGLRDYGLPATSWEPVTFAPVAGLPPITVPAWEGALGLEPDPWMFVGHMVAVFRLVRDVLTDDGLLWLNLGDSYNAAGRTGHGTRQGFKQGTNRASAAGADQCRPSVGALKPKDLVGIPWRVALALQADGWYLRQDIIWHKPNPMPESVRDRCTKAHEYVFMFSKSERYYFNSQAISEPLSRPDEAARKTPARFGGAKKFAEGKKQSRLHSGNCYVGTPTGTRNRRSVWTIPPQPYKESHFAVFPEALVEPCILAGSRPGDIVLDPFGGSGTVGAVALRLGRDALILEANPAYVDLARKRVSEVTQ